MCVFSFRFYSVIDHINISHFLIFLKKARVYNRVKLKSMQSQCKMNSLADRTDQSLCSYSAYFQKFGTAQYIYIAQLCANTGPNEIEQEILHAKVIMTIVL